jgi:phage regulator Rha-like protein
LKADDVFTDSLVLAKGTKVEHRKIKSVIKKHEKKLKEFGRLSAPYRAESTGGRPEEYYILNEAQATFLVTLLKNTDVVVNFKAELVRQFFEMRKFIAERHTEAWLETRQQGKLTRKAETDVIKELIEYAKAQGSTHADMLYVTYTKLANSMCGIRGRDSATVRQLNNLSIFENLILQMIRAGIEQNMNYKQIYQVCKDRCIQAQQIAMIGGA